MDRREFLTALGVGTLSLSGCASMGRSPPNGNVTSTERTQEQTTGTATYKLVSHSFHVLAAESSLNKNHATVSFVNHTIEIRGIIQASKDCYSARLENYDLTPNAGALDVSITTYKPSGAENCTDTSVGIKYEAKFEFAGRIPGHVYVTHNGEQANDGPEVD